MLRWWMMICSKLTRLIPRLITCLVSANRKRTILSSLPALPCPFGNVWASRLRGTVIPMTCKQQGLCQICYVRWSVSLPACPITGARPFTSGISSAVGLQSIPLFIACAPSPVVSNEFREEFAWGTSESVQYLDFCMVEVHHRSSRHIPASLDALIFRGFVSAFRGLAAPASFTHSSPN
jgi:hypothetical protein